jgi:hypothetical protein
MSDDNYWNDYNSWDESDKEVYNEEYYKAIRKFSEDPDFEAVIDELATLKYNPSSNPQNDAKMNFESAKNKLLTKRQKAPQIESYRKFMKQDDELSESEVNARLRKYLREPLHSDDV